MVHSPELKGIHDPYSSLEWLAEVENKPTFLYDTRTFSMIISRITWATPFSRGKLLLAQRQITHNVVEQPGNAYISSTLPTLEYKDEGDESTQKIIEIS